MPLRKLSRIERPPRKHYVVILVRSQLSERLEAPAGALLGLRFPLGLLLVLGHLAGRVLVRVVVVLVLLQAAAVVLLLAVRVLGASVIKHQRTRVTVVLGALLVSLLESSVASAARVLLHEVSKAAREHKHAEFHHHCRKSSRHPEWVLELEP